MDAGVGHQAAGAPHLVGQPPEPLIGVAIDSHLAAEFLCIQTPALDEGADVGLAAEHRHALRLLAQRDLQMMAGHGFVQGQGRQLIEPPLVELVGVDHVAAGDPQFWIAREITAGRVVGLDVGGDGTHAIGQARQGGEPGRKLIVDPLGDLRSLLQQVLARGGVELRIGAQEGLEGGEVPLEAGLGDHAVHLPADPRDLVEAVLVDLVRGQLGGRVVLDQPGIVALAAR